MPETGTKTVDPRVNRMVTLAQIIGQTIKEMGDDGAPSGPIYAAVMSVVSFEEYQVIIDALKRGKLIEEKPAHVLRWIVRSNEELKEEYPAADGEAEPHVEVKKETGTWSVRTLTASTKGAA